MPAVERTRAQGLMMRSLDERDRNAARDSRDDRLTVRQAIVVWLAAAAAGWLLTVGAVYLAARVF